MARKTGNLGKLALFVVLLSSMTILNSCSYMIRLIFKNENPTVSLSASATSIAQGEVVTIISTAYDPEGKTLDYSWRFDGMPQYEIKTTSCTFFSYEIGTHTIELVVYDPDGGTGYTSIEITVN